METKVVRIGLFDKKEDLTIAEFRDYWRYHHAAIASNMHGMMQYDQNHVVRKADTGLAENDGTRQCNGFSQIWFNSMDSQKSNDPETMGNLAIDEEKLFGSMDLVVTNQKVYKAMNPATPYVKYMCFLKRKPEISEAEFAEKFAEAAKLFLNLPGIVEYREDIVDSRLICDVKHNRVEQKPAGGGHAHPSWTSATYEQVPIDGVAEFYFKFSDKTAIDNVFDTAEAKEATAFTRTFLEEANCFVCDVHRIVNKFIEE